MMRHAAHFFLCRLVGDRIQTAVALHRIVVDHLSRGRGRFDGSRLTERESEFDAEVGLADAGGTNHSHQRRF